MSRIGITAFDDMRTAELFPVAGWTFPYNVNTDIVSTTLTASGTVTHSNAMAECNSGAAVSSGAVVETVPALRYVAGLGGLIRFTAVFGSPKEGNFQRIGLRNGENGFYVGYSGTTFGIFHKARGVETHIPVASFNGTRPDIVTTTGNVFFIQYQWLGFGVIRFGFEKPNGEFVIMHQIEYPNSSPLPSLGNPSMKVFMESVNTTNATNVTIKSPSSMAFREGAKKEGLDPLELLRSFESSKTLVGATETPLLAFRAKATYQSISNMIQPLVSRLSLSADGTKNVIFRLYRGATLTGSPVWTDFDASNSSIESDVAASGFTGGDFIYAYTLGKTESLNTSIDELFLLLDTAEIFLLTAESALASDVTAVVLVKEGF